MTCQQVRAHLQPFLDGDLSEAAARDLCAHLATCAACQGEWQALRAVDRALAGEPVVLPPPELAVRIIREAARLRRQPHLVPGWLEAFTFLGIAAAAGSLAWVGLEAVARAAGFALTSTLLATGITLAVSAALAGASIRHCQL